MNNIWSAVSAFVNKHSYLVLLVCFLIWMSIGVFPLNCYEADSMAITMGADVMYREGWVLPPICTYEYRMQPLITIVLTALKHLMPFFTCEQIYCGLSALTSVMFLFGCVDFGHFVTKLSRSRLLIAAMFLPEMYAVAMYPNTAIYSATCFIWAMVLITKGKHWLSLMLLCIATWFRIDVVIVYPVIFPLFLVLGKTLKQSFWSALAYGFVIVILSLIGFWVLKAPVFGTVGNLEKWNDIITPELRFFAIYGFYSLAYFILLPLGLVVIGAQKLWKELFLVLLPIVLMHVVLSEFGNASKHFLYNAPFVIIAGSRAIYWLGCTLEKRTMLKWGFVGIVVMYLTLSVRRNQDNVVWLKKNPFVSLGTVTPLATVNLGGGEFNVSIGGGQQIITRDEYMLGTGHIFYSWYIHCFKKVLAEWSVEQKQVLDGDTTVNILALECNTMPRIGAAYLTEDYHFCRYKDMPFKYDFSVYNEKRDVNFWRVYLTEAEQNNEIIISYVDTLLQVCPSGKNYVVASMEYFSTERLLDDIAKTGKIEKKASRIYLIKDKK